MSVSPSVSGRMPHTLVSPIIEASRVSKGDCQGSVTSVILISDRDRSGVPGPPPVPDTPFFGPTFMLGNLFFYFRNRPVSRTNCIHR